MSRVTLLSCVALLIVVGSHQAVAVEPMAPSVPQWEYKAILFNGEPADGTKLLNDLNTAGWEYVGPLANGLVAFRRPLVTAADTAAKKELDRLQGTWATTATELDGQQRVEERKERLTIVGPKWTVQLDREVTQQGILKIADIGGRFVQADFIVTDGYKQGDTWTSIYQIDGDKMRWCGCYVSENKVRPKMLSTREGDGYFLRTLKREK